jgi:signal transduction histidine kinase
MTKPGSSRWITATYVFALSAVAALSITSYLLLDHSLDAQKGYAAAINVAGRQRRLLKGTVYLALRLVNDNGGQARAKTKQALLHEILQMEKAHSALFGRDPSYRPQLPQPSKSSLKILSEPPLSLERWIRVYFKQARLVAELSEEKLAADAVELKALMRIEPALLIGLERMVHQLQHESEQIDLQQSRLALAVTVGICLALVCIGVILFRPMVQRIEHDQYALLEAEDAERNLRREQLQLERITVAGEMAATAAQEIRTPLNALGISAQRITRVLRKGGPDLEQKVETIILSLRSEIDRVNSFLESYLAVLGPFGSKSPEVFELDEIVSSSLELMTPEAQERDTRIEFRNDVPGQKLNGIPGQLRQVLLNVLLNGLESIDRGGVLKVRVQTDSDNVIIRIEDSGGGIGTEEIAHVFEPFFTTKRDGAGLGLAVCQRVVERMNGVIDVESPDGGGARFNIRLPLA